MRAVLPGKPQATLEAVCTSRWSGQRIVAYISGNALVILRGPHDLVQTIYHDDCEDLDTVVIDEHTGKIATCSGRSVQIHRPFGTNEEVLKWSLHYTIQVEELSGSPCTLSWGTSEELMVGSSSLQLYQTSREENLIWSRTLSSPVIAAVFSPNGSMVASIARYDRLVKIWRRLSYASDGVQFDSDYLPHPAAVTGIRWRKSGHAGHGADNVLYTTCADTKVRVWAATDPHGLQVLQLWAEIDAQDSIQPRYLEPGSHSTDRYIFIIESQDFKHAMENAVQASISQGRQRPALEHLLDIAENTPEVCVILDSAGHMSAWGLENIGKKTRSANDVFNIAHIENFNVLFPQVTARAEEYVRLLNFSADQSDSTYTVLVHHFDGRIVWLEGKLDEFFVPAGGHAGMQVRALWTGHDRSIKKIVRTASGKALVSRTNDNQAVVWKQQDMSYKIGLARHSYLDSPEHIHRTCLLDEGNIVACLHHHKVSLWDARILAAEQVSVCDYLVEGKPLCLLQLPSPDPRVPYIYLATISSHMKGIVWQIQLYHGCGPRGRRTSLTRPLMKQFCSFDLGTQKDLISVVPVDPAGLSPVIGGFLDTFAKDICISYTNAGVLRAWTATVDVEAGSVKWLVTATLETGVNEPTLASGNSIRKIAVVDSTRNGLSIWDTFSGQLEYENDRVVHETIQDLDWTSTPDQQSILAVGFPHRVVILAQIRYDYLNKGPAWASIREIHIRETTSHPIGDSTWMGNGSLVIGAGNQLFVYDKLLTTTDEMIRDFSIPAHKHAPMDLFDLVALLNGPLPVFHPQFLAQCILAGKIALVQKIVVNLHKALKFFSEGDKVDSLLDLSPEEFYEEQQTVRYIGHKEMQSAYADFTPDDEPETVDDELATRLNERLARLPLPYLTSTEQFDLADLVECAATAEKHRRSMDDNAMRYLLFFRQHMIRKSQAPERQVGITWREIAWAFQSGSQDILVDLVSKSFKGRMVWEQARESGVFMWMTDISAVRAQFEVIARNEYTKTDEKNPIDCSLYYLALKKKNVLLGLWRMASWNREQSSTQKLLSNNFNDPRWKTAALKNAYALLGKRRFGYAVAFFLLAGNLRDAVNVCSHQLHDLQLAVAIARVYEGDDSPVLHELLEDKVLPMAALQENRWLAMWTFWMLGRKDMAVRALISPVYTLVGSPESPRQEARSFLTTDPALVVIYKQLRDKTLQTLKGASKISPRAEWQFVLQTARLYDRMGCDLLALDLVRNWDFLKPEDMKQSIDAIPDPRKMLRRRSSLVVDDMPAPRSPTALMRSGGGDKAAAPAKIFEEPDAGSLLDSFGF